LNENLENISIQSWSPIVKKGTDVPNTTLDVIVTQDVEISKILKNPIIKFARPVDLHRRQEQAPVRAAIFTNLRARPVGIDHPQPFVVILEITPRLPPECRPTRDSCINDVSTTEHKRMLIDAFKIARITLRSVPIMIGRKSRLMQSRLLHHLEMHIRWPERDLPRDLLRLRRTTVPRTNVGRKSRCVTFKMQVLPPTLPA
jgi:hypothetical protein